MNQIVSLDDYAEQKFFSKSDAKQAQRKDYKTVAYEPPAYPAEALGPLADVCQYVSSDGQVNSAIIGQSLLATASLITQALYDVETPAGRRPLSLYCLTIAESGDGKSVAESVALNAVRKHEKAAHEQYKRELELNNERKKDEKEELRAPYRISNDATVSGIIRDLKTGFPAQGCFTAEGAAMLCGWGMSSEQKLNSGGVLNRLWDGEAIAVSRGGEGRTQLYNRRFAAHWLIQPDAAKTALFDAELSNLGFWPRFLIAWPPAREPRRFKKFEYWKNEHVQKFWRRCDEILKSTHDMTECDDLKIIKLSTNAEAVIVKFFEKMEQSCLSNNPLHEIKAFSVRATEQVCRVAAVLAAFERHNLSDSIEITDVEIKNAIKLVSFSLENWLEIFGKREAHEQAKLAEKLYQWLKKRDGGRASEQDMLQTGPRAIRTKAKRDTALSILKDQARIERAFDVLPDGSTRLIQNEWIVT